MIYELETVSTNHKAAECHSEGMSDQEQETVVGVDGVVVETELPTTMPDGEAKERRRRGEDTGTENVAFEMDSAEKGTDIEKEDTDARLDAAASDGTAVVNGKTQSIANLALVYATKSTVHGLPSTVSHAYYKGQRQFWVLLVLVMGVALGTAITLQLKSYYEWPTVINIRESHMDAIEIPEVTICRQEQLGFAGTVSWDKDPPGGRIGVYTESFRSIPGCDYPFSSQCVLDHLNRTREITRLMLASLDRVWMLPADEYYPKVVTDIEEGICNTFKTSVFLQAGISKFKLDSAKVPLDIILAIKPQRQKDGHRTGLQITLHTKDNPPFPRKYRIPVQENTSCRIEYKKVKRTSLTTPYKSFTGEQCVDTTKPSFKNPLIRYNVYTKDACMEECFVNFTISQLGCRYHLHPGTEAMCNESTPIAVMKTVRFHYNDHKHTCECPPPCEDTQFEASVSCSPIYRPPFEMLHIELVSVSDMKTETIQRPLYSTESILGSLGGLIGLFMGFSLVSIMEFVELIIIAISRCCAWRKARNTRP